MKRIITLAEKLGEDVNIAGSKASKLWKIKELGVKLPKSLIVTTHTFREYLRTNGLERRINKRLERILKETTVDYQLESTFFRKLFDGRRLVRGLIQVLNIYLEELNTHSFAVRSSATLEDLTQHSFAGVYDSFLNISIEDVPKYVLRCWSSLFSPRSLFYRKYNNISEIGDMGVLIQGVITADLSGVMFTIDPVNKEKVLIEITEGSGENLVAGKTIPVSFFVSRDRIARSNIVIKNRDAISVEIEDGLIVELAKTGLEIESFFGKVQDIEFCVKNGEVFIIQTRDITTSEVEEA